MATTLTIRAQEQALRDRYGIPTGRTAKPVRCRHCKQWTLRGLDSDLVAFTVAVNPTPLSRHGEAVARILGLATYTLERIGAGTTITRRNHHAIRQHPADTDAPGRYIDVVAEHRCSNPTLPDAPSRIPTPSPSTPDGPCPY